MLYSVSLYGRVAGGGVAACLRLRSWRFRSTCLLHSASKDSTPSQTLTFHECRSCAMVSQLLSGMLACASDRFSWSLKRRFGPPLGHLPSASFPYRILFGRRVGGMRAICPTQHRHCWRIGILYSVSLYEIFLLYLSDN